MPRTTSDALLEVFSAAEIARAAAVDPRAVAALVASGDAVGLDGRHFTADEAVRAVRRLTPRATGARPDLFEPPGPRGRRTGMPFAVSGTLHAALVASAVLLTTMGLASPEAPATREPDPLRLVFLATPGPGGGGGGGGRKEPAPVPRAQRKGTSAVRSPIPVRRPPPRVDPPVVRVRNPPPPPLEAESLPPVIAPIAAAPAENQHRIGVMAEGTATAETHGPGAGGGAGTGAGPGLGEGDGAGVGPGAGGGTSGGPYRPGSGITPPTLLREVKPDYTEEGRQRGVEGDVVLEIVVGRDGSVGKITVLQGLGAGLDRRAIDAVRQWRFSPALRLGAPVDVIVEVAVEFELR